MFYNYATHKAERIAVEEMGRNQRPGKGRWYIKPGFAGYNCRANNLDGFPTRNAAEGAIVRYQGRVPLSAIMRAWEGEAEPELVEHIRAAITAGVLAWRWDPEVDGVAGIVHVASPNKAVVVVYADGDWECDERAVEVAHAEAER